MGHPGEGIMCRGNGHTQSLTTQSLTPTEFALKIPSRKSTPGPRQLTTSAGYEFDSIGQ